VFEEPWQAQAFALVVQLHASGAFTWTDWAAALADELRGKTDDGTHYYDHWLGALERLVSERGLLSSDALVVRKLAWAEAYRHTPHGQPVEL
jgi:nitrile hydratase accessory protein